MSGISPRLVANEAGAVAPNTLHVVRVRPGCGVSARGLAAMWQTSLTRLSAEIEGHSLGGGMLKLEPGEAGSVLLAPFHGKPHVLPAIASQLDQLLRKVGEPVAEEFANVAILKEGLGLSQHDCRLLKGAADALRHRRYSRGSAA